LAQAAGARPATHLAMLGSADFFPMAVHSLARAQRKLDGSETDTWPQGHRAAPGLATKNCRQASVPSQLEAFVLAEAGAYSDAVDEEEGNFEDLVCKKISISTCADDDTASCASESEEDEWDASELIAGKDSAHEAVPPLPSVGSALHGTGLCKPCAWLWKGSGCQNGVECLHCHACPEGELQARKKAKVRALRLLEPRAAAQRTPLDLEPRKVTVTSTAFLEALAHLAPPGLPLTRTTFLEALPHPAPPGLPLTPPPGLPAPPSWAAAPGEVFPLCPAQAGLPPPLLSSPASPPVQAAAPTEAPEPEALPSVGSALHSAGLCKPCAWFWKPQGCENGQECGHCHSCPEGALRARRQVRQAAMRAEGVPVARRSRRLGKAATIGLAQAPRV